MPIVIIVFSLWVGFSAIAGIGQYAANKDQANVAKLKIRLGEKPTKDEAAALQDFPNMEKQQSH